MGNANAGGWRYTARYGWNWRSARAISSALGSLALPMPPWFRMVVARCLLTRTALHADAQGIWGSAGPLSAGRGRPVPVAGRHGHRRLGVRPPEDHRDRPPRRYRRHRSGGQCAGVPPPPRQSPPTRRAAFRRHPSYPAFIGPDGSPYDVGNVVTTNGWCVDTPRLQATVRHFAPRARFTDLSGLSVAPDSGGPFGFAFEVLAA